MQNMNFRFAPLGFVIGAVVLLLIFWSKITVTIPAGYGGVLFRTFGGGLQKEAPFGEGFHFISPWNKMYTYELRQQEVTEAMQVLSSNGLEINVDVSVWFQPRQEKLGHLHAEIGETYVDRIVIPSLRSAARSVIGRYAPEEIYSTKRESIQGEIDVEMKKLIESKFVAVNQVLIRSITLPPTIKQAIEGKLKQEQESLEYEFKLQKAQKEAARQKIDAEGKAIANQIVSASLTDKILKEKGIEATLKLAESPNTKVVIVGGADGLPFILNDAK